MDHDMLHIDQYFKCEYSSFFIQKSIFDPRPKNCLSFSKKLPQKSI